MRASEEAFREAHDVLDDDAWDAYCDGVGEDWSFTGSQVYADVQGHVESAFSQQRAISQRVYLGRSLESLTRWNESLRRSRRANRLRTTQESQVSTRCLSSRMRSARPCGEKTRHTLDERAWVSCSARAAQQRPKRMPSLKPFTPAAYQLEVGPYQTS